MFIVKNCPAIKDLMEWTGDFQNDSPVFTLDTLNYCTKNKQECKTVTNCIIKNVIKSNDTKDFKIEE